MTRRSIILGSKLLILSRKIARLSRGSLYLTKKDYEYIIEQLNTCIILIEGGEFFRKADKILDRGGKKNE